MESYEKPLFPQVHLPSSEITERFARIPEGFTLYVQRGDPGTLHLDFWNHGYEDWKETVFKIPPLDEESPVSFPTPPGGGEHVSEWTALVDATMAFILQVRALPHTDMTVHGQESLLGIILDALRREPDKGKHQFDFLGFYRNGISMADLNKLFQDALREPGEAESEHELNHNAGIELAYEKTGTLREQWEFWTRMRFRVGPRRDP